MTQFISPATNLDDLFRACDPERPLAADDEQRYVELSEVRGTKNLAKSIARRIVRSRDDYHQQLVTGHRGCGKSTELLRLKQGLESQGYFTIYLDVEDLLDLVDIDYLDVLLAMAREVEKQTREAGFSLNARLLEDLYRWFSDRVLEKEQRTDLEAELETEAEAGGGIPLIGKLLARFTADIRTASSTRTTTRQTLERELPVFVDKLNALIGEGRHQVKKDAAHQDLVVIVDGLEKMHYRLVVQDDETIEAAIRRPTSTHDLLFLHHAEQLKAPNCHLVYTVPITLAFNANLRDVFDIFIIPMVKTDAPGLEKLTEIVRRRAVIESVFTDNALLQQLVCLSGGVVRDLMHLIRLASDTDAGKIGEEEVRYARQTLIKDYDRTLRNADIDALRKVHEEQRVQADQPFERLLNLRIVLEYENGERWAGLHPAVLEISWVKDALKRGQ